MHPFEKAGLGTAPFRCVGVFKNVYCAGAGAPIQPGGSCDFCGTGIMYEYKILGSDGRAFKVGCDCVRRTGGESHVAGVRNERLKLAREQRSLKREARQTEWKAQREVRRIAELETRRAAFIAAEPALAASLEALPDTASKFMLDMRDGVRRWGSLTEGQLGAVKASIARDVARMAERANSTHVGVVGKRQNIKLVIQHRTSRLDTHFYPARTSYWFLLKAGDNVFTYRGSVNLGNIGETVEAKWSVKEHTEYQGTKQTVLARPTFPKVDPDELVRERAEARGTPHDHAYNNADRRDRYGAREVDA